MMYGVNPVSSQRQLQAAATKTKDVETQPVVPVGYMCRSLASGEGGLSLQVLAGLLCTMWHAARPRTCYTLICKPALQPTCAINAEQDALSMGHATLKLKANRLPLF